jgi:ribosomal protein S4E
MIPSNRPYVELFGILRGMKTTQSPELKDGATCTVIAGTHAGKSGIVRDIHTSKTGAVTITVVQENGERFKTLAKNVVIT